MHSKFAKIISILLISTLIFAGCVIYVMAETETGTDGYYSYSKTLDTVTITSVDTSISGEVVIPSEIAGGTVTKISEEAFANCIGVTKLIVPNSVESIGKGAFKGLYNITEITLPFVGESRDSSGFKGVFGYIFGYDLGYKYNGSGTYSENLILTRYGEQPSGTTWQYTYRDTDSYISCYCYIPSSLKKVTITDATQIGMGAFMNCKYIVEVNLNDKITSIGYCSFYECANLSKTNIPNGIEQISSYQYKGCSSLSSLSIPNSVKNIEAYAFYACESLESIALPNSLSKIEKYSFYYCKSLTDIKVPNGVTHIGSSAFESCLALKSVTLSSELETIDSNAFKGCSSLIEIELPQKLQMLGTSSFENCSEITRIVIPDSVKSIGSAAFKGLNKLSEITLPFVGESRDSSGFKGVFGYIFGYDLGYKYNGSGTYSENLILTRYGEQPSGTTWQYTYRDTDSYISCYCYIPSSLKKVTITDATQIGMGAFMNCKYIVEVNLNDKITSIGYCSFYECANLSKTNIPNGIEQISSYQYKGCSSLSSLSIPNSVKDIGTYAFYECVNLKSISLPGVLEKIGSYAFSYCKNISSIIVPDNVTYIGYSAFNGMTNLTEITIPFVGISEASSNTESVFGAIFGHTTSSNSSETVGVYQYSYVIENSTTYCYYYIPTTIEKVTITKATYIPANAFYNCSFIKEINLSNMVSEIGNLAFKGCSGLTKLYTYNDLTSIGTSAFNGCTNLTVYGHENSYVETYCKDNSINFYPYETVISVSADNSEMANQHLACLPDLTGLKLIGKCFDGTEKIIIEGFTTDGTAYTTVGTNTINIYYNDFTITCDVNVIDLTAISVAKLPDKTNYIDTDMIDTEGLILNVFYPDGFSTTVSNEIVCETKVASGIGQQLVTVSYLGKKTTYKITVTEKSVTSIEIETPPAKTNYYSDGEIDTTGIRILVNYNNGDTKYVTDGFDVITKLDDENVTAIVIRYDNCEASYDVNVTKAVVNAWILTSEPDKKNYKLGEDFEPEGIVITEYYNSGKIKYITEGFTYTPEKLNEEGEQIISISYLESESVFTVNVTHNYKAFVTLPTCTERGYTTHICACGDSYVDTYVDTVNHSFTNYVYNNDAHIGVDGTETAKCDYCTETNTRTKVGSAKPEASCNIKNIAKYNNQKIAYKASLTIYADAKNCTNIKWHVAGAKYTENADGSVKINQATDTFSVYFTAKDLDGEEVKSETETVNVKNGFFDRIIAFFKGFFGSLPNLDQ